MVSIIKPEIADLRDVWKSEAHDFTPWLSEHLDFLKDSTGLDLTIDEIEKPVGSFSVDIHAKDSFGRSVIIENQLEQTNHDHLGKVLTYLSNLEAKVAIWISAEPRPEHKTVIDYLNENLPSDTSFYLIKIQAMKTGDSTFTPIFSLESGPSEERRAGGMIKKELAEKDARRYRFFTDLLEHCKKKTNLFANVSPVGYQGWVNAGAGKSGLMWALVAMDKRSYVNLYLCGSTAEINTRRYKVLEKEKTAIEKAFGGSLEWDYKADRKQQYIRTYCPIGGIDQEDKWDSIQNDLVNRLIQLELALRNSLKEID